MLSELLCKPECRVSSATRKCVDVIGYPKTFKKKKGTEDLSEELRPLQEFVGTLMKILRSIRATDHYGKNLMELKNRIDASNIPLVAAHPVLDEVLRRFRLPIRNRPEMDQGLEPELTIQRSYIAAETESAACAGTEISSLDNGTLSNADDLDNSFKEEVDIIGIAITYALDRWLHSFPSPRAEDIAWPIDFTKREKREVKTYVSEYLKEKDMLDGHVNKESQARAIDELRDGWPIAKGMTQSVVQTVFLELRQTHKQTEKRRQKSCSSRGESEASHSQLRAGSEVSSLESEAGVVGNGIGNRKRAYGEEDEAPEGHEAEEDDNWTMEYPAKSACSRRRFRTGRCGRGRGRGRVYARSNLESVPEVTEVEDDE
jgi:hypothetical protein